MGKVRVFELSKQVNIPSKDLVDLLNSLGVPTANHMSAIDENAAKYVLRKYGPDAEKEKAAPPKQKGKSQSKQLSAQQSQEQRQAAAKQQPAQQPQQAALPRYQQAPRPAARPIAGGTPRAAALQQAAARLLQAQEEQRVLEARLAKERAEAEKLAMQQAALEEAALRKAEAERLVVEAEASKAEAPAKHRKHADADKAAVVEAAPVESEKPAQEPAPAAAEEPKEAVQAAQFLPEELESEVKATASGTADEAVKAISSDAGQPVLEEAPIQATLTSAAAPIEAEPQAQAKPAAQERQPRPAVGQGTGTATYRQPAGQGTGTATYRQPAGQGTGTATYRQPAGQGTGTATYRQPAGQGTGTATYRQPMGQGTGTATYRQPMGQGTGTATYRQPTGQGTGTATYRQPTGQGNFAPRPQGAGGFAPRPQGQGGFGPRKPQGAAITVPPPVTEAPLSKGKGKSWGTTGKERRFTSEDDSLRGPMKGKTTTAKKGRKGMSPDPILDKRLRNIDVELLDEDGNVVRKSGRKRERPAKNRKVIIEPQMTVRELALKMEVTPNDLIRELIKLGVMASLNQSIDSDTAQIVAAEFGVDTELKSEAEERETTLTRQADDPSKLKTRPPVVTIMGHVDHGKTSLLDAIRKTNVALGEAGGITQRIGAYQVELSGRKITFIDTPGHAAFTSMRAKGAQVTDIVVLVVAADDGVMPQTIEAYNHAKSAGVPVIVAVNKIDKPNAQPDRVLQELSELGLVAEKWGGDTVTVDVSAIQKIGISELMEMILLVADMRELKANFEGKAQGIILDSYIDTGLGTVAHLIVKNGTLKTGDYFLAGEVFGKVRVMLDYTNKKISEAPPSAFVKITGLPTLPPEGGHFEVVTDEKEAKQVAQRRTEMRKAKESVDTRTPITLEDFFAQKKAGQTKDLNVILKGDTQGAVDALRVALEKLSTQEVRVLIVHSAVGAVSENDVMLASTSDSIIIAYNVRPDNAAAKTADEQKVDIKSYRVIYDAINDITLAMEGMLDPEFKEVSLGKAEVRAVFSVPKAGNIAGSYITAGKITRNSTARIVRDGKVIHEGKITSLRRFKDDAKEVSEGFECGIGFESFNDIKEGDVIEAFGKELVKRVLQTEAQ